MIIWMTKSQQALAIRLFKIGAFMDKSRSPEGKGFRMVIHEKNPDLPLSPFYLNLRTPDNPKPGPLDKEILSLLGRELIRVAVNTGVTADFVTGVPRAGDPIVEAFIEELDGLDATASLRLGKMRRLRLVKKEEDGIRKGVSIHENDDDLVANGGLVLLVDDLITKADSKIQSIEELKSRNLDVIDVLVAVDRLQGGSEELRKLGHRLISIFTINQLLFFYLREGFISQAVYSESSRYLENW